MREISKEKSMQISGCLLAWHPVANMSIMLVIEDKVFVPIFSTKEKLKAHMKEMDLEGYVIKQIDDGAEFLSSVIEHYGVALDPYKTPEGNTRFHNITELK